MGLRKNELRLCDVAARVNKTIGGSQEAFGKRFGVSRRTVSRWRARNADPTDVQVVEMARLVLPFDRAFAEQIASELGETLESLGLVPRPPPPGSVLGPLTPGHAGDLAVIAAAEVMDASPRAIRPALLAAVARARVLGLTLADLERALGEGVAAGKGA